MDSSEGFYGQQWRVLLTAVTLPDGPCLLPQQMTRWHWQQLGKNYIVIWKFLVPQVEITVDQMAQQLLDSNYIVNWKVEQIVPNCITLTSDTIQTRDGHAMNTTIQSNSLLTIVNITASHRVSAEIIVICHNLWTCINK